MSPTSIFNVFGHSPIHPLQEHMKAACVAVEKLIPFFEDVFAQQWDKAEAMQKEIARYEKEADGLKKEIRLHLPKGIFLPVSRVDLLELVSLQDALANTAEDIAGLIVGRQMVIPSSLQDTFRHFVQRSLDATQQAKKAIEELDELLETGFRGNEVKMVEQMIEKLHKIEGDTDQIQISLRKSLFAMESTIPPVEVIFLYKIIHWIGDLADEAQRVGNRFLLLLAR